MTKHHNEIKLSAIAAASTNGQEAPSAAPLVLPPPSDPMAVARVLHRTVSYAAGHAHIVLLVRFLVGMAIRPIGWKSSSAPSAL